MINISIPEIILFRIYHLLCDGLSYCEKEYGEKIYERKKRHFVSFCGICGLRFDDKKCDVVYDEKVQIEYYRNFVKNLNTALGEQNIREEFEKEGLDYDKIVQEGMDFVDKLKAEHKGE